MDNLIFRQHAVDCGLNMTCADACHVSESVGLTLAHDVLDPVHLDRLALAGTTVTSRMADWFASFGVDYITFRT